MGKSAAEGPDSRLLFDLIGFSNNKKKDNPNRFVLVGIDEFTFEMSAVPLKAKKPEEVNAAFGEADDELVGDETNYVVTTNQGPVFAKLGEAMPNDTVYRQKEPADRNAIVFLDRNMQGLKVGLAGRIAKKGGDWSVELAGERP